jgi:phosphatidyl-myo-inositol dimannoside synthase
MSRPEAERTLLAETPGRWTCRLRDVRYRRQSGPPTNSTAREQIRGYSWPLSRRLLLLAPSSGYGRGIQRASDVIEHAWRGPVARFDLYDPTRHPVPEGNLPAKLRFSVRVIASSARWRPQIVFVVHIGLLPVGVLASLISRAPLVLLAIGDEVWGPMGPFRRVLVQRCAHLAAISSFTAERFSARVGVERERVSVLELPISERLSGAAAATTGRAREEGDSRYRLVTVSRIASEQRYKGHFAVAEALPDVIARQPNVLWTVVGEGDDLPSLHSRCEALGISQSVEFLGRIDDEELRAVYQSSTVLVMPSVTDAAARPPYGEGFGLVYAEAAAHGVPSIGSTAGGGSLDFVEHGRTGLQVPPDDKAALTEAILRLLEDTELRARLGAEARERVAKRHTSEHFAAALARMLG